MISLLAKFLPAAWPLWIVELIFWAVVTVGGVTAVALFWHTKVAEPYRIEGDNRTRAKLQPKIDELEHELDGARANLQTCTDANSKLVDRIDGKGGLVEQIATAQKSVDVWKQTVERVRAANAALAKELDKAIAKAQSAIDRAKAIASGPAAATFEDSCRDADAILLDLAKRMTAQ